MLQLLRRVRGGVSKASGNGEGLEEREMGNGRTSQGEAGARSFILQTPASSAVLKLTDPYVVRGETKSCSSGDGVGR